MAYRTRRSCARAITASNVEYTSGEHPRSADPKSESNIVSQVVVALNMLNNFAHSGFELFWPNRLGSFVEKLGQLLLTGRGRDVRDRCSCRPKFLFLRRQFTCYGGLK